MFQGYYGLTSGMLTQTRNLDVISNNMANVSTTGYKSDQFIVESFGEAMVYNTSRIDQGAEALLGSKTKLVASDRNYTDFSIGAPIQTTRTLDFSLADSGFFVIQTPEGNVYTRNGSFSLDGEGYLTLQGIGRVLGTDGAGIQLGTDEIVADSLGNLYNDETGTFLGRIATVDFADYDTQLLKEDGGVFVAQGQVDVAQTPMTQKTLEGSNVDVVYEMTQMMASNRALQSSAQVFSMYDQLLGKIVSQLGPT